jgi:hypothetical protein
LIFLWIFVDQLYIQMGVKNLNNNMMRNQHQGMPGSTKLVRKKSISSNVMVIDHSNYTSYASLPRPGKVLQIGEVERRHQRVVTPLTPSRRVRPMQQQQQQQHPVGNGNRVVRTKSMSSAANAVTAQQL